jgi:hypothetical protein
VVKVAALIKTMEGSHMMSILPLCPLTASPRDTAQLEASRKGSIQGCIGRYTTGSKLEGKHTGVYRDAARLEASQKGSIPGVYRDAARLEASRKGSIQGCTGRYTTGSKPEGKHTGVYRDTTRLEASRKGA